MPRLGMCRLVGLGAAPGSLPMDPVRLITSSWLRLARTYTCLSGLPWIKSCYSEGEESYKNGTFPLCTAALRDTGGMETTVMTLWGSSLHNVIGAA